MTATLYWPSWTAIHVPTGTGGPQNTIPNSMTNTGSALGAGDGSPNFGKLYQHKIDNVVGPMQNQIDRDRGALRSFLSRCR